MTPELLEIAERIMCDYNEKKYPGRPLEFYICLALDCAIHDARRAERERVLALAHAVRDDCPTNLSQNSIDMAAAAGCQSDYP